MLFFTYNEFKDRFGEHSFIPKCNEIILELKDDKMIFNFDGEELIVDLKQILDIWFKITLYEKSYFLLKKGFTFNHGEYIFIDTYKNYLFFFVENPDYGSPYCIPVRIEDTKLLCEFYFNNGVRLIKRL